MGKRKKKDTPYYQLGLDREHEVRTQGAPCVQCGIACGYLVVIVKQSGKCIPCEEGRKLYV